MFHPPISIHRQNSDLYAVPAIHFSHIFAAEVNRICFHPATQPDAIAVELGPQTAIAVRNRIRELETGAANRFPVMFGLIKRNRMIRASFKEKAFRLQRKTGKDLSELPPEILYRELGFTDHSILYLSPVDSIIEAIRCSIQLGVPLYGVDLEEMANGLYKPAVIQDPQSMHNGMAAYLKTNAALADATRDPEIDLRRETAMTARIRTLMRQYSKVLFTCGMAHWQKISQMFEDDCIKPAPVFEEQNMDPADFKKTIIHPSIAVQYMDLFPALAEVYEERRIPVPDISKEWTKSLRSRELFRRILKKAFKHHFDKPLDTLPGKRTCDLEAFPGFEAYLHGMQQLAHRAVPDLSMVIQAAKETMSEAFVNALTETFMKYPWVRPEAHPDCPVLMPPADEIEDLDCATLVDSGLPSSKRIYLQSIPDFRPSSKNKRIVYKWDATVTTNSSWYRYTWRPWEYLISSMTFQAIQAARKKQPARKTIVFEGNLLDGIDMKSTLRDFSRGKNRFFVRDRIFKETPLSIRSMDGFPVVWILSPEKHDAADWKVLIEPLDYIKKHVRNAEEFQTIRKTKGDCMVASIGYGYSQTINHKAIHGCYYGVDHYHGIAIFQPIFWTNRQFAQWAEMTRYNRNPIYGYEGGDLFSAGRLKKWCEKKHGIALAEHDWPTGLALMVLPFCRECLTVVMPESCRLEPIVFERARRDGVRVATHRLEMFSPRQIERLAMCQMVPAISVEPETKYETSVERAIGESQTQNRELVPMEWLTFGANR
ncbi:MAG: hypothetical protein JXA73_08040 [Acidobacteria bacterium]|nr:hypothetical protein [Acidobacteriota bacterium]